MRISNTLNRYLAFRYLGNLFLMLTILLGIVYLFDTVELLRRAGKRDDVSFFLVLQMGLFKLPEVGQLLFPFAVLFSAMFTFWQLNRKQELVVIRAAGLSVWQFMAPVVGTALLIGALNIGVVNPIGAALLGKFETLENEYLGERKSYMTVLREGLWLRQTVENSSEHVILHAGQIDPATWSFSKVMVLFFGQDDNFDRRIDAQSARLDKGMWVFEDAVSYDGKNSKAETLPLVALPTDLTKEELEESFASPETLSFWALPGFIQTMNATGFDSTPMKIHFQSLLAQPFMFAAMVLLAACVSLRPPRQRGTMLLVGIGITAGFIVFFVGSFLQALGASHQIPVFLAAWAPTLITFLLGLSVMLTLEDG